MDVILGGIIGGLIGWAIAEFVVWPIIKKPVTRFIDRHF